MLDQHPSQRRHFEAEARTGATRRGPCADADARRVLPDGDILSCVVYARPGTGPKVAAEVEALPGAQVHAGAESDKLVVTIEDVEGQPASELLGAVHQVEDVINAILIYHFGGRGLACPPSEEAVG